MHSQNYLTLGLWHTSSLVASGMVRYLVLSLLNIEEWLRCKTNSLPPKCHFTTRLFNVRLTTLKDEISQSIHLFTMIRSATSDMILAQHSNHIISQLMQLDARCQSIGKCNNCKSARCTSSLIYRLLQRPLDPFSEHSRCH